ncbi:hypothetical protein [Flavobacterium limi]|uniref:hypothetical protein n=1 Tax=Flavobacterium limi TaxID=2045105 RepID=UPI0013D34D49|nr:hypothetical protein [Flavobacterium limi]
MKLNKKTSYNTCYKQFGNLANGKIGLYLEVLANPKIGLNLVPNPLWYQNVTSNYSKLS